MVNKHHKELSLRRQSELLSINRSMLYYKKVAKDDFIISNLIREIYTRRPIYGHRRIAAILKRIGYKISRKKVLKLMKIMGLRVIYSKPKTSQKNNESHVYRYLLAGMNITKAHQVWQVDITYLRTDARFMYLVAIIDVYSRMIVGYRLSNSLCTESCVSSLEDAIHKYGAPEIVNSDQGSQFTSNTWINKLRECNVQISMTGKGRCCDNAYIERLWRALKHEGTILYQWRTAATLKANIGKWVYWYNYQRPHQALEYKVPAEFIDNTYSSNFSEFLTCIGGLNVA